MIKEEFEMDELIEKHSTMSGFVSSPSTTADADNNELPTGGGDNSASGARTMTITDGRFFKLVPEKCMYNSTVATCVKCEPGYIEIKGTINSSSNFLCHLKRKHGTEAVQEYTEYLHSKKRPRRQTNDQSQTPARQNKGGKSTTANESLEGKVLKFIISAMVPLQTVVRPSFLALFRACNVPEIELKVLNTENLTSKIEQLSQRNDDQVKTELRAAENVFCTINIWTAQEKRYLAITAHWISSDMKRKSAAIKFQKLSRQCDSEKVATMLNKFQDEFEIRGANVSTLVGEYTQNILKAFNAYGICNSSLDGLDADDKSPTGSDEELDFDECFHITNDLLLSLPFNQVKCPVQILTICASTDVVKFISGCKQLSKLHERVMRKCNVLWNHPQSEEILEEITGLTLTRPRITNWVSIYNSLREILTIKDKSVEIFQAFDSKCLVESEILYIEEHLACIKPYADALTILQGTDYTLYGSLLPTLLALRRHMNNLLSREWVYCRPLAVANFSVVNERFKDFYNLSCPGCVNHSVAALSHPEFKNRWFSCVESKHHIDILQAFKEAVAEEIPPARRSSKTEEKVHCNEFFDFGTEDEVIEPMASFASAEMQVLNFLRHSSKSLSILDNFPAIKKVFLKYNSPLSSFATLENMFKFDTLSDMQSADRLDRGSFEMRILLRANMDMLEIN